MMTHKISFQKTYKSITHFPATELPDLVILTGENGSGKSHLLEALNNGSLVSTAGGKNEIKLFDWNTIVPINSRANLTSARVAFNKAFDTNRNLIELCKSKIFGLLSISSTSRPTEIINKIQKEKKLFNASEASKYKNIKIF